MHLVYVAGDGSPAVDRGLTKRTYAAVQDAVVVLGCPLLEQTMVPVDVAEGLADALALGGQKPRSCRRNPGHLRHELRRHRPVARNLTGHPGMG